MKTRDWTIERYRDLCVLIKDSGRVVLPVVDYLSNLSEGRKMVIRHDVDISAKKALSMAGVEHCFGFRTSYYFRKRTFSPKIMYQVSQLGHEVGYHYEVLDRTRGDYSLGERIFKEDLEQFRSREDIKTVCMHGNPLTSSDNRDFWKRYRLSDFGLVGECYLSFDPNKIVYFTDTDRTWECTPYEFKDVMIGEDRSKRPKVRTTDELFRFLQEYSGDVYLLTHPERWSVDFPSHVKMAIRDHLACAVKYMLARSPALRKVSWYIYG
jgi:hypothetical protein